MGVDRSWGIVGHRWAVQLLRRALERGELSHAYLLTGPQNVGKMSLARALAAALFCEQKDGPCGTCRSCRLVAGGTHPDMHLVEPDPETGRLKIEQVRDLQRQLTLTPHMADHRLAVLNRFELATPQAASALLKTLEEPPEFAHLVLLAPDTDSLLPTIVSRCQVIPLRPLAVEQVQRALEERWNARPEQARLLAHLCGGRIGWAAQAARDPAILQQRQQALDDLVDLLRASPVERFRHAARLARDGEGVHDLLDLWAGWWRDVMLLAGGAAAPLTNVDQQQRLAEQAGQMGLAGATSVLKATRAATDRLRRNANPLLALEVLLVFDLPRLAR